MVYYQFAVMPPYRGLKECPACHSQPGLYATAGDWMGGQFLLAGIRLKAGMTDCELRHDQLTA